MKYLNRGAHPINLALRFILEVCALISVGLYGWHWTDSLGKYVLALLLPLTFGAIWGIFAVPNDPSRSGKAPIRTPGIVRLLLELLLFATAIYALYAIGFYTLPSVFGTAVLIHYAFSYDRIKWLMTQ